MACKSSKKKGGKPKITPNVKIELSNLITIKKMGSVSLRHHPEKNLWAVSLGFQRTWMYRSSTWAQNKYRRLLIVNGEIDEVNPLNEFNPLGI